MTYEVQIFKMTNEGHLTKEMNKRTAEGWRVISTTAMDRLGFIVTWGKES